ncbi:MAG: hypothetical protein HOP11_07900 [Saprospiraceae bacterium]|nr:hypothetical protein [Saprospiraceae bacterium]
MKKMLLLILTLTFTLEINGQCDSRRKNINDATEFTDTERDLLRSLIIEYASMNRNTNLSGINQYPKLQFHAAVVNPIDPSKDVFGNINNPNNFNTWNRYYLQGLEQFLLSKGHSKFVPLPYWNPTETLNQIFKDSNAQLNEPANTFPTLNFNFNSTQDIENLLSELSLSLPLCDFSYGVYINKVEIIHDQVILKLYGDNKEANLLNLPGYACNWLLKAFYDDLAYCYQKQCNNSTYDLYTRDDVNDVGNEPSNAPQLWVSPDIWVRNSPDGFANQVSEAINESAQDKKAYVYVRVWNKGQLPSLTGVNNIKAYWAKASAGLGWPAPWDGDLLPGCPHKLGDLIGEFSLRSVNEDFVDFTQPPTVTIKDYNIYEFEMKVPDPDKIAECFPGLPGWEKHHFCILALMDDGLTNNMSGDLYDILNNNNNIAMKNVTIYSDGLFVNQPQIACVFLSNYTQQAINNINLDIKFQALQDNTTLLDKAQVKLYFKDGLDGQMNGLQTTGVILNNQEGKYLINNRLPTINGINLATQSNKRICFEIIPTVLNNKTYIFDLIQKKGNITMGGERYEITLKGTGGFLQRPMENSTSLKDDNRRIILYPNPSNGILNIASNGLELTRVTIKDSKGIIVLQKEFVDNNMQLDLQTMQKGSYQAEFLLENGEILYQTIQLF